MVQQSKINVNHKNQNDFQDLNNSRVDVRFD
jgi:hypothetical protein